MNKKKLIWQLPFLVVLIVGTVIILKKQPPFRTDEGFIFGTVYKITSAVELFILSRKDKSTIPESPKGSEETLSLTEETTESIFADCSSAEVTLFSAASRKSEL